MDNIREVRVRDLLVEKATRYEKDYDPKKCFRKIKLYWEGREEPELRKYYDPDTNKRQPLHVWKRKDGESELHIDAIIEAEANGLNPGLEEERNKYRELHRERRIKEEAKNDT